MPLVLNGKFQKNAERTGSLKEKSWGKNNDIFRFFAYQHDGFQLSPSPSTSPGTHFHATAHHAYYTRAAPRICIGAKMCYFVNRKTPLVT